MVYTGLVASATVTLKQNKKNQNSRFDGCLAGQAGGQELESLHIDITCVYLCVYDDVLVDIRCI